MSTYKFNKEDLPLYHLILGPKIILVPKNRPGIEAIYGSIEQARCDPQFHDANHHGSKFLVFNLADYAHIAPNPNHIHTLNEGLASRVINVGSERIFLHLGEEMAHDTQRKLI